MSFCAKIAKFICLFFFRTEPRDEFDADNWNWEETSPGSSSTTLPSSKEQSVWLKNSMVSLSPSGKILVLAYEKQLVVLNGEGIRSPVCQEV
jgi:hypothetical protein